MKRKIVEIDEAKCNGCGLCANACHEGAIAIVDGKARLVKDDYCDGMGDCLPECPTGAIRIVERDAAAYDEKAVQERKVAKMQEQMKAGGMSLAGKTPPPGGCPGKAMRTFNRAAPDGRAVSTKPPIAAASSMPPYQDGDTNAPSELAQWPCQIRLVPATAPFFKGAKLLIAADCTAYAYAAFHHEFMRGKVTIVGCPKLDPVDYSEKLTEIIRENDIKSVTIVRMEVPCCGGLELAAKKALQAVTAPCGGSRPIGMRTRRAKREPSGKFIPWQVVTISLDGRLINS